MARFRHTKQTDACSAAFLVGLNHVAWGVGWSEWLAAERRCDTAPDRQKYATAFDLGTFFPTLRKQGWQGGGFESLMGVEVNNDNPDQMEHHSYEHRGAEVLKCLVDRWHLGTVSWTEWSSGAGDTGSQLRAVQWALRPYREMEAQIDLIKEDAEGGCEYAKAFLIGYERKLKEGERW